MSAQVSEGRPRGLAVDCIRARPHFGHIHLRFL